MKPSGYTTSLAVDQPPKKFWTRSTTFGVGGRRKYTAIRTGSALNSGFTAETFTAAHRNRGIRAG
jgi:hypothetical protein